MQSTTRTDTTGRRPAPSAKRRLAVLLVAPAMAVALVGCARSVTGTAETAAATAVESISGAQGTESTEQTEQTESTEQTETSGSTESTESSEQTESSGQTETVDQTEPTGSTGSTGTSSDTATGSTTGSTTGGSESGSAGSTSSAAGGDEQLYPTTPRQIAEHARSEQSATLLESRRLATYVPVPTQVDARFSKGGNFSTVPYKGPSALSILFVDPVPQVAKRAGMYAGFSSARTSPSGDDSLITAAFVFPDAASAKEAATSLAAAAKDDKDTALTVPHHPKATGSYSSYSDSVSAQAFEAVGSVVAYTYASSPTGRKKSLPATADKALTALADSLKDYHPTPKGQLGQLPVDPDGLYARTLPQPEGKGSVFDGVWSGPAFLHYVINVPMTGVLFQQEGVDAVARSRSNVYRAAHHASAIKVHAAYIAEIKKKHPKMTGLEPPGGAADTTCLQDTLNARYYCTGAVGRYVFEYWAESESDMERSVAAQLELLTA